MLHKKRLDQEAEEEAIREYDEDEHDLNKDEIDDEEIEVEHSASGADAVQIAEDGDDDGFENYDDYDDFFDDDDQEEFTTPLDSIDEVSAILDFVTSLQSTHKAMYDSVVGDAALAGFLKDLYEKKNEPKPEPKK
eukprot:TRINITY_DN4627_c0_g1_i3.p1 TRINITY_DN4627_c0_g1~~TRINITY_DN4627_c0_g1_i3.p1  ORF type:complete len:135 (-),score=45.80 TRINITY_DN4627_c0_g1_i3:41-445(-)